RVGPQRAERGNHPVHLAEEERAGLPARVAAEELPALAQDAGAELAERALPADRLPGHHLLLGAATQEVARQPRGARSGDLGHLPEARHSARRTEAVGGPC